MQQNTIKVVLCLTFLQILPDLLSLEGSQLRVNGDEGFKFNFAETTFILFLCQLLMLFKRKCHRCQPESGAVFQLIICYLWNFISQANMKRDTVKCKHVGERFSHSSDRNSFFLRLLRNIYLRQVAFFWLYISPYRRENLNKILL